MTPEEIKIANDKLDAKAKEIQSKKIELLAASEAFQNERNSVKQLQDKLTASIAEYDSLIKTAKVGIDKRNAEINNLVIEKDKFEQLNKVNSQAKDDLDALNLNIEKKTLELRLNKEKIDALERDLSAKEALLAGREASIESKIRQIATKEAELAGQESSIINRTLDVTSREKDVEKKEAAIKVRELQVAKAIKDKQLQAVLGN